MLQPVADLLGGMVQVFVCSWNPKDDVLASG